MRRYQDAIREAAVKELAGRLGRLVRALECPADRETPSAARTAFPPVRKPSPYGRGTDGEVFCFKAGGLVPYESALERDFYRVMEWDYTVDSFVAQPYKIPYCLPSGRLSMYTPDCFVLSYKFFQGGATKYEPTAFEIKYRSDFRERWPQDKAKYRSARSFMRDSGFRFRLLTEAQLNPCFVENITFLLGFRGTRFFTRTARERHLIDAIMEAVIPMENNFTPRQLLAALEGVAPRAQIIPWMWNLYSDYVFQCDLLEPLTLDTLSWRCGMASSMIANFGMPDRRADWRQDKNDWRR